MAKNPADDWVNVVEAFYQYETTNARGHSVIIQPGEMYYLIRDTDDDWWFVGRSANDEDGFYFPHTYGKIVQRQQHRLMEKELLSVSADSSTMFAHNNGSNRFSTFGGAGGGSGKRRSYQLATITDSQLAIYDNPMALNATQHSAGENNGDQNADSSTGYVGHSLLRRKPRGPGFKLPEPSRISRSIPVDLNFVHNIPNDGDERMVSFYGDQQRTREVLQEESQSDSSEKEKENVQHTDQGDQNSGSKSTDGPIYANVKPMSAKELPPLPVAGSDPINVLHDGWAEYVDKNNRRYFYNAKSKKAMWKPPRFSGSGSKQGGAGGGQGSVSSSDELDASFVSDDGEPVACIRDHALSSSVTSAADISSDSVLVDQIGPNINVGHLVTSFPCPPIDIRTLTAKRSTDTSAETNGDHHKAHDTSLREVDVYACSEDLANIATKIRSSSTDEYSPGSDHPNGTASGKSGLHGQGHSHNCVRSGVLNRCKYMEAGKRVKKQWVQCFVYLTNAHLLFYKDEKAAEKKGNQYPTPLGVCDLRGAKLRWLEGDLSRRKNVFQVELLDVTIYLFHAENQTEINGWYDDLRQVIDQLPIPDCYPTPSIENSPTRFSIRKPHTSKGSAIPPDLPKHMTLPNSAKDADKRKSMSVSFSSQSPTAQQAPFDVSEQALQKETILEKLRKFFRSRPSVETLKERGIYKAEPVFGSSLIEICRREKTTVPKFIITCTALIEEKGLSADGLYRINGNLSQVQRIRCQVDQEKYGPLLNEMDVHVLTGALKLFFRELQEPAFPTTMTKDFLNAIKLQNGKQRHKAFSELISKLPRPHHDTLDHLFQHLLNVAKNSSKNRMQIHNLAIVFGPSLFSSNPSAKSSVMDTSKAKTTKKKVDAKTSSSNSAESKNGQKSDSASSHADVTHSNSQLAFTMILQGQIVEYLLKEQSKFFKSNTTAVE